MITTYVFLFLSFLALLCALMVVFSKNPVHSVLYLVLTFFAIAGHYILMNAQFLAIVHLVVYAGAIMVLFLFVIMLLNMNDDTEPQKNNFIKFAAVISGGIFLLTMVASLKGAENLGVVNKVSQIGLIKNLGTVLFNEFLLPFELSSILLLAAMVGAVYMGKKELTNNELVK
jgi:NADH-quinone oxidoreductase subunit J